MEYQRCCAYIRFRVRFLYWLAAVTSSTALTQHETTAVRIDHDLW